MTIQQQRSHVFNQFKVLAEKLEEMYPELTTTQVKHLEEQVKICWEYVDRRVQR